jgi:hypothetical protein
MLSASVELLCDIEQIVAQQSAFHSLGGVPDEPRSFSALLGGRVQQISAIDHASLNEIEAKWLPPFSAPARAFLPALPRHVRGRKGHQAGSHRRARLSP